MLSGKSGFLSQQWLTFLLVFLSVCFSPHGNAQMISNSEFIEMQGHNYSHNQLQTALHSEELQEQLKGLGVDVAELEERVARLTPAEIEQLNKEFNESPTGSGVVGALVFVFVVFVFTDMLCATDIFNFVNCIN